MARLGRRIMVIEAEMQVIDDPASIAQAGTLVPQGHQ
jgi:hypothetical protein